MKRFRAARDRGCAHLLAQQHADGSFGNLALGAIEYYKVPAAFQVCGEQKHIEGQFAHDEPALRPENHPANACLPSQ